MTTDKKALKDMLDAGCHFGHKTSKWNPKIMRYIFAKKEGRLMILPAIAIIAFNLHPVGSTVWF